MKKLIKDLIYDEELVDRFSFALEKNILGRDELYSFLNRGLITLKEFASITNESKIIKNGE